MNHEGVGHISEDNMSQNSLGDGLAQLSSENVEERATFQRQLDNPLFCKQIVSELKTLVEKNSWNTYRYYTRRHRIQR